MVGQKTQHRSKSFRKKKFKMQLNSFFKEDEIDSFNVCRKYLLNLGKIEMK